MFQQKSCVPVARMLNWTKGKLQSIDPFRAQRELRTLLLAFTLLFGVLYVISGIATRANP
jgi:hypothetical protein